MCQARSVWLALFMPGAAGNACIYGGRSTTVQPAGFPVTTSTVELPGLAGMPNQGPVNRRKPRQGRVYRVGLLFENLNPRSDAGIPFHREGS